ncbi:MAG: hypothetical protein WCO58_00940 [bacterium]
MKKTPVKKEEKYVTEKVFEKHMIAIGQTLARHDDIFNRIDKALETIIGEIRSVKEDTHAMRNSIRTIDTENIFRDKSTENLRVRVEKLESKVK